MNLVFEEIWSRLPQAGACGSDTCRTLGAFVAKAWIVDQIRFHESTYRRNDAMSRGLEKAGEVVFTVAMLVALAHFALHWTPPALHGTPLAGVLTLATLMLPALGATLGAVRSHREYKRLARRSRKMAADLEDLKERFTLFTPDRLEALLREAEQLMLRETSDWLALMKFAELHKAV